MDFRRGGPEPILYCSRLILGGCSIDSFRKKAYYLFIWRALLVALVSLVLMVTGSFELRASLFIAGTSALLFSLALVAYAWTVSDEQVARMEPWRLMRPGERPAGAGGRRLARHCLSDTALRFAEGASGVAIALLISTLLVASEQ